MDQLEFSVEAEQALSSLMGTLRSTNEADLTTRLVKVSKHGTILEKALGRAKMREDIFSACNLGSLPEGLARVEIGKSGNWGTCSRRPGFFTDVVRNDSLDFQVSSYFSPRQACHLNGKAMEYADSYVSQLYSPCRQGRLRPLGLDEASARFHRTGLGFPVVSSNAEKYFAEVLSISRRIWESSGDPDWVTVLPGLAGLRGQPLGPPHDVNNPGGFSKTRLIFQMPRALTNLEKCLQAVLFDVLRERPEFSAWNSEHHVDVAMTRLLSSGRRVLSVDFKKFDQSVPFEVIDRIYAIIRSWFVLEATELVDFCQEVFKRSGILVPDRAGTKSDYEWLPGCARTGGVPSGSVMTNLIDSLVNAWVMAYAAAKLKTTILAACYQGDDAAVVFRGDPSMADLSGELSRDLGMTLSPTKSTYLVGQVTFLQNVHNFDHSYRGLQVGVRPIMHASNMMGSHERMDSFDWVADDYETIRVCQQAGYCLHHPRVTELCDWLAENDPFAKDVLARVKVDSAFYLKACEAVRRKDSNSQKGFSPQSLWSSPVFQYMLSKV